MTPWTEVASAIALGIGANTENFPVGLAYGLRKVRIGLARNLFIAAVTTAATLAPLTVGHSVRRLVPMWGPDVLGGLFLVGLGLLNIWLDRRRSANRWEAEQQHQRGSAKSMRLRETFALAGALSLNNIGLGFAGGVAGLGAAPVALSVAGFSIALLWLGEWMSQMLFRPLARAFAWLRLDGNLLIVGAGILMMVGA